MLGFPCNQFGGQEPGTDEEISEFCSINYQVKFPIFKKVDVNSENAHPLYKYLREQAPEEEFDKNSHIVPTFTCQCPRIA